LPITQQPFPHFTDSWRPGATHFTNVRNVRIIERFFGDWSAKYSSKLPHRFIFIGFIGRLRR
jgi:hypothetical protein